MLFMMGRHGKRQDDYKEKSGTTAKPPGDNESR
jgi:hypothetical protein